MQVKSTLPSAEVTVLPLRALAADQRGDRQSAVLIEQPVAPVTQGADGDTCQADRALHAMLARRSGGISPAALLLAYTDWLSHLASAPQRQTEISQETLVEVKRFFGLNGSKCMSALIEGRKRISSLRIGIMPQAAKTECAK